MADIQKEVQQLNLVDGDGLKPAIMITPSAMPTQCAPADTAHIMEETLSSAVSVVRSSLTQSKDKLPRN